jgi:hypothetical protein
MHALISLAALAGLGFSVGAGAEDTYGPASAPAGARSFRVGVLRLTALHDAQYVAPNDGETFGVDAGSAAVSDMLRAAGAPTDRITLSVNALLARPQWTTGFDNGGARQGNAPAEPWPARTVLDRAGPAIDALVGRCCSAMDVTYNA